MIKILCYGSCLLLLFGCPESSVDPQFQTEAILHYENLITGESGTLGGLDLAATNMYSSAGAPFMDPPPNFRQSIQATFKQDSSEYPTFQINFFPILSANLVKPIPGQTFGQLYTYEDPEDYLAENFTPGNQLIAPLDFNIRFGLSYPESSLITKEELANEENAAFSLEEAIIYYDEQQLPQLYLRATFSGTLINDAFGPFSLQPHFRITSGHFAFAIPVDLAD